MGFKLYLVFVVSWFLHLGSRVPVLGLIRFDLLLIIILFLYGFSRAEKNGKEQTQTEKLLKGLMIYSILTMPFVEWPGSVINTGIPNFIKAIVFYYFTVAFVVSENHLKTFVLVFMACQSFRILEPLYLHITEGYWGAFASMANGEYLDRLSGAPSDVVNSNGLAFIICTVLPFLYFTAARSWKGWIVAGSLAGASLYALVLTGSRTGILGLIVVYLGILVKAKRRVFLAICGILAVVIGFPMLSPDIQDRYLSIIGKGEKHEATAQGRLEGTTASFDVALRRPLFGHGLGTSREANANFAATDQPTHNLYAEVAQELGFVGLVIFIVFMKSIAAGFVQCKRAYANRDVGPYLPRIVDAMQVWLWMNIIFSFASYGLSSYEWYLLAGFSVVMQRLAKTYSSGVLESANAVSTFHKTVKRVA